MKVKKFLPHIITAVLSMIMLVCAFSSSRVIIKTFPFTLYEKMGMFYKDEFSNVVFNKVFSMNGTLESFITFLKNFANKEGIMSTMLPAVMFSALIITAFVLIINAASKTNYIWSIYLSAALLPIVFLDFSNVAYFKTLYNNPLILTLLLLLCAVFFTFYKRNTVGIPGLLIITVITLLYSCIGYVQAISSVVIGVVIVRLFKISKNKASKILSIILGCVIIIQSVVFTFNFRPYDYKQTIYNSVFFGVCKYDSVTELGLDKSLDDFKEVYYGMKENEADYDLENNFYNKISYKKLIGYYLTHPINTAKLINNQASLAFYNDYDFGFTPYNSAKKLCIPMNLIIALVFAAVYIIIALTVGNKYNHLKPFAEFLSALAVMWILTLISTTLYCGNCDTISNMYTFNVIFDILLTTGFICGVRTIIHRQEEKKEEFGITHE